MIFWYDPKERLPPENTPVLGWWSSDSVEIVSLNDEGYWISEEHGFPLTPPKFWTFLRQPNTVLKPEE
jgi:hypothetical protein